MMTVIGYFSFLSVVATIVWVHILASKQLKSSYMGLKDNKDHMLFANSEYEKLLSDIKTALIEHKAYTDMVAKAAIDTKAAKKDDKKDTIITESGEVLQFQGLDLFS